MELIPGLPNDIARECLFRVHCTQLSTLFPFSKAWSSELQSPEFWRQRKQLHSSKRLILLKCLSGNIYKLIVFEPERSIWSELPPIPEFPNGLPVNFQFRVASFRWGFVVVGFKYLSEPAVRNKVFVFDYLTGTWRRGTDIPTEQVCVHRCTSDRRGMVYVLSSKVCQQWYDSASIMVYDVMKDKWTSCLDVEEEIKYCRMPGMIYQGGKIHFFNHCCVPVINLSVIDVSTWKWDPADRLVQLDEWHCDYDLCLSAEGDWYSYSRSNGAWILAIYKDLGWKEIDRETYNKLTTLDYKTMWESKVLVIQRIWGENEDDVKARIEARVFDLKKHKWDTLDVPKDYLIEVVKEGCILEI